jgi:molecular chaperone DnaK (HSP70)
MKEAAENMQTEKVTDVVVTVPVYSAMDKNKQRKMQE